MINFNEFTETIMEGIKNYLPGEYADAEVALNTVTKNNGIERKGLIIKTPGISAAPTIYLDDPYNEYLKGLDNMDAILRRLANTFLTNVKADIEVPDMRDYKLLREKLLPKLVNAGYNEAIAAQRPHRAYAGDLIITYVINVRINDETTGAIPVTNELLYMWGVTENTVYEDAMANLPNIMPMTLKSMGDVLSEIMMGGNDTEPTSEIPNGAEDMYVLSSTTKTNGAVWMADEVLLANIREKMGNFYIIPSSIHEVLIIPEKRLPESPTRVEELNEMINEVNFEEVEMTEQLGDHVYYYGSNGLTTPVAA